MQKIMSEKRVEMGLTGMKTGMDLGVAGVECRGQAQHLIAFQDPITMSV